MKFKHFGWILGAMILASVALAGDEESVRFMLFNGTSSAAADSSEKASPWIPVRGANRVLIRTWSNGAAAYTGADSAFVDSLGTFKVLFSDSVSFMGRDSLGTLVTARSTQSNARAFPVCADSVMITGVRNAIVADTTAKFVGISNVPIEKQLRSPVTGGGYYTTVFAVIPPGGASIYGDGSIGAQYMRVRVAPKVRATLSGAEASQGARTWGINGLRMEAIVIYKNR